MSSASVYSEYYSFYIDTGMMVSVAQPPPGSFGYSDTYVSDYFEDDIKRLRKKAIKHMGFVDSWVEDIIATYPELTPLIGAKYYANISFICEGERDTGTQTISIGVLTPLSDERTAQLQTSLCRSKKNFHYHRQTLPEFEFESEQEEGEFFSLVKISRVEAIDTNTHFGHFTSRVTYIREDLSEAWNSHQLKTLHEWMIVVEKTIQTVEKIYDIRFSPAEQLENNKRTVYKKSLGYGGVFFEAAFITNDKLYADEVAYALSNYYIETAFKEKIIDELPDDVRAFLTEHKGKPVVPAKVRAIMNKDITDIERALQQKFTPYGVNFIIEIGKSQSYAYRWDYLQQLHTFLALFEKILNEVDMLGKTMKLNGVFEIRFYHVTHAFSDSVGHHLSMSNRKQIKDAKYVHSLELDLVDIFQKNQEALFNKTLLGGAN